MLLARLTTLFLLLVSISCAHAQEPNPISQLDWKLGPMKATIGSQGTLQIPQGFAFLGAEETKKFMEINHNFSSDKEYLIAPASLDWFATFEFDPSGYVKDDESIDADSLLKTVKENTRSSNEERRRRGWGTMSVTGWRFPPRYDQQSKRLEWALLAADDQTNAPIVNYNTRILGRTGVMRIVLVADPSGLDNSVATLKTLLSNYEYLPGQKYAEFREGDHVAEYGLAALIAGGAAAVAAKKGLFATVAGLLAAAWKLVVAAVIGAFAWLKSIIFKKKS